MLLLYRFIYHTHEGSGNAIYSYGRAVDAGVDVIDLAYSAFANGTSQPSMNSMYYALSGHDRQPEMNIDYMEENVSLLRKYSSLLQRCR